MLRASGLSRGGEVRCHSAACRQASHSTQAPRGRMSPLASARGMNSVGATSPRTGWRQRARASAPMCMSALEGDMDARVAEGNASPNGVTAGLASPAALRAFGSAAAVALAPRVISEAGTVA
jgi:hypothetical protein